MSARAPFYVSAHMCGREARVHRGRTLYSQIGGTSSSSSPPLPHPSVSLLLLLTPDIILLRLLRVPTPLSFTASKNKSLIHNAWMTIALKRAAVSPPTPTSSDLLHRHPLSLVSLPPPLTSLPSIPSENECFS